MKGDQCAISRDSDKQPFSRDSFKKPFNKDGGGGFKKPFNKDGGGGFKKPFNKDGGGFKKPFNKDGGGFKKPFNKDGEGGFKKPFNKDGGGFKKPFNKDGGGFKKPFNKDGEGGFKKPFSKPEIAHDHKEQKELRFKRRDANPTFTIVTALKPLWEQARVKELEKEKRKPLIDQMMELIKGKVDDVVFKHDSARIVQCCFQFGNDQQRAILFEELKEKLLELTKTKYSKFVVPKLLQYGTKVQRDAIIKSFYGHVRQLIRHKTASQVVALAYADYANTQQKCALVEEFYKADFAIFKSTEKRTLSSILEEHPEQKDTIVKFLWQSLSPLLEKSHISHTIIHRALLDYFTIAPASRRQELIEAVRDTVVEMVHTKEGSRVAMLSLIHGNAKDRKIMLKTFKSFITKICLEEHGHFVLLTAFDVMDDTVALKKAVFPEILEDLLTIAKDRHGRKVLLYLLAPRSPKYFVPEFISLLAQADGNPNSKKEPQIRQAELLEGIASELLALVTKHAGEFMLSASEGPLVAEIIARCSAFDQSAAFESILTGVDASITSSHIPSELEDESTNFLEHSIAHRTLKRMVGENIEFAKRLLQRLRLNIKTLAFLNRPAFVIAGLMDSDPAIKAEIVALLTPVKSKLKDCEAKGSQVLFQMLSGITVAIYKGGKPELSAAAKPAAQQTSTPAKAVEHADSKPASTETATPAKSSAKTPKAATEETKSIVSASKTGPVEVVPPVPAPIPTPAFKHLDTPRPSRSASKTAPKSGSKPLSIMDELKSLSQPTPSKSVTADVKDAPTPAIPSQVDATRKEESVQEDPSSQQDAQSSQESQSKTPRRPKKAAATEPVEPSTPATSKPGFVSPPMSARLRSRAPKTPK